MAVLVAHPARAQNPSWRIDKTSGTAWIATATHKSKAIADGDHLQPGEQVRTGADGRVLLSRDATRILVSPNTIVGLLEAASGRIAQLAGSILLDSDKDTASPLGVETPHLGATSKNTQFGVTINRTETRVDVLRGFVEVVDFRSGQFAVVKPDQSARVSAIGSPRLSLTGSGTFNPVYNGPPRPPLVSAVAVPTQGLEPDGPLRVAPGRTAPAASTGGGSFRSGTRDSWLSWFGLSGLGGARTSSAPMDDITLVVSIPLVVGLLAALVAAVSRRRRAPVSRRPTL